MLRKSLIPNYTQKTTCNFIERKATINGLGVNYLLTGNQASKKTLFLMPGSLGTIWTDFKLQIEYLPVLLPNYKIIAWDPPGCGKSIPPQKVFSTDCYERDAEVASQLLKALNVKTCDILGWSGGGISSLIICSKFLMDVPKLIIFGTGSYIDSKDLQAFQLVKTKGVSPVTREPLEKIYGKERFSEMFSDWLETLEKIYKDKGGDFGIRLKDVKADTLIIQGLKDRIIFEGHGRFLKENIPKSTLIQFPEGRHNMHLAFPEKFNQIVADFLLK